MAGFLRKMLSRTAHTLGGFRATPGSITTIMSLDRLAIHQRWGPNWRIWSSPVPKGPRPASLLGRVWRLRHQAWHEITIRSRADAKARRFRHHARRRRLSTVHLANHRERLSRSPRSTEAFAWDEGEGDRTGEWWLHVHSRYFGWQASRKDRVRRRDPDRIRALRGRVASRYRGHDHGTVFIRRTDRKR